MVSCLLALKPVSIIANKEQRCGAKHQDRRVCTFPPYRVLLVIVHH